MDPISASSNFTHLTQVSEQGMMASRKRVEEAALKLSRGDLSARNVVEMQTNQRSYEANAKVLKTADEMAGTLLDTLA